MAIEINSWKFDLEVKRRLKIRQEQKLGTTQRYFCLLLQDCIMHLSAACLVAIEFTCYL